MPSLDSVLLFFERSTSERIGSFAVPTHQPLAAPDEFPLGVDRSQMHPVSRHSDLLVTHNYMRCVLIVYKYDSGSLGSFVLCALPNSLHSMQTGC